MTTIIVNVTQHSVTADQLNDLEAKFKEIAVLNQDGDLFKNSLTFISIPTAEELSNKAKKIANDCYVMGANYAIIAGAPYFMPYLEKALIKLDILPIYSFSERISNEIKAEDGSVKKISTFKHVGFIEANADIYEGY